MFDYSVFTKIEKLFHKSTAVWNQGLSYVTDNRSEKLNNYLEIRDNLFQLLKKVSADKEKGISDNLFDYIKALNELLSNLKHLIQNSDIRIKIDSIKRSCKYWLQRIRQDGNDEKDISEEINNMYSERNLGLLWLS